jgi:hypothetical protein
MKNFIKDYCLLPQMNTFGPIFFDGLKSAILVIFQNDGYVTFKPIHENQKKLGPNVSI